MPAENRALLKTGLDLVRAAEDLAQRKQADHCLNDQICRALRKLYFVPNGILALLKELKR